jgi:hypothetical protein
MITEYLTGPWLVNMRGFSDGGTGYQVATHSHSAVAVADDSVVHYWGKGYTPERDDDGYIMPDGQMDCSMWRVATGRLIAAAPELLEALQEIAAAHLPDQPAAAAGTDYDWACRHIARLRGIACAAIAKATGAS